MLDWSNVCLCSCLLICNAKHVLHNEFARMQKDWHPGYMELWSLKTLKCTIFICVMLLKLDSAYFRQLNRMTIYTLRK